MTALRALLITMMTALLALGGCTASDPTFGLAPLTTGAITSTQLKFADSDPQDFGRRPPAAYPVHGIDISKWQGAVDWPAVRRSGIAFAFIKATEGGDMVDPRFDEAWRGARAAGIAHAPYHFYYFCTSAADQARWFIRNVPRRALAMPPVLDMEWNHHSPSCKKRPPPEVVRAEMQVFLDMVERHYGKRPIIYTTVDFHERNLKGYFGDYPFWLRSVADHPDNIYGGRDWHFWQYTGTGVVPGVTGPTDINVFAGNAESWRLWLAAVNE